MTTLAIRGIKPVYAGMDKLSRIVMVAVPGIKKGNIPRRECSLIILEITFNGLRFYAF